MISSSFVCLHTWTLSIMMLQEIAMSNINPYVTIFTECIFNPLRCLDCKFHKPEHPIAAFMHYKHFLDQWHFEKRKNHGSSDLDLPLSHNMGGLISSEGCTPGVTEAQSEGKAGSFIIMFQQQQTAELQWVCSFAKMADRFVRLSVSLWASEPQLKRFLDDTLGRASQRKMHPIRWYC